MVATDKPAVKGKEPPSKEEQDKARDQFSQILNQSPFLGGLLKMLGLDGASMNPADLAVRNEAQALVGDAFNVSPADEKKGLKPWDGTPETMKSNLAILLDEKFKAGTIVFDQDPTKNAAGLAQLKTEINQMIDKSGGKINPNAVVAAIVPALKNLEPSIVHKVKADYPPLQAKADLAGVKYGPEVKLTKEDLGKMPFASQLDVNGLDKMGNMEPVGKLNGSKVASALGDDVTISRVEIDGENVGYRIQGKEGGYYVGPSAINTEKAVAEMGNTMTALLAPMPKVEEPKPQPLAPSPGAAPAMQPGA